MAHILVVDDEPKMTSLVCGELEEEGFDVTTTTSPVEALDLITKRSFDLVITDLSMPEVSGMEILEAALKKEGTAVVMMTAFGTVETAVTAMKKGAADYLLKPFSLEELILVVKRLTEGQKQLSLADYYRQKAGEKSETKLIGSSASFKKVLQMMARVAPTESTVLITGRSGTGKELAAAEIHRLSKRAAQPFIAVNCAALTETLLESELFGHEKGAFTGAVSRKRGRFELADKGTIFLDEIGETSPGMQSKLLRVIEEKKLVRVGGIDQIAVDVRIIAATNRVLKDEMKSGSFREDLYFRLNVFPIEMPTLIDRVEDIVPLAEYMISSYPHPSLSDEIKSKLIAYDWPGNIRELRNVMERATILAGGEPLTAEDFSLETDDEPLAACDQINAGSGLETAEKEMIEKALEKADGNKTEAARLLKITRRRLYSRMKVHGIKG